MRILQVVFILFFVFKLEAQNYELENVTFEELMESKHHIDTSAVASIMFKKQETNFKYKKDDGFVCTTDFSIKIKIYKKEGLKFADFKIPYFVGYSNLRDESVKIVKAYTYNLSGNKIIKTKVTSESKFENKLNEFWETKIIAFPDVKVGSIIELRYVLKSQNLSVLPDFQFQYSIPVDYAEYISKIPEFYIYKAIKQGYVDVEYNEKVEQASQTFDDKYGNLLSMNYKQINSRYQTKNVPSLIEENFSNNIENYYGKIDNELQIIRMPNEEPEKIATTWEDVTNSIYKEKNFGEELFKTDYFAKQINNLLLNQENNKMDLIFNYVKNNIVWNGKYGYFPKTGVEEAFKNKTGNVAEINLMLVSMLNYAGLNAFPILISTKDNGIAIFPSRTKFNYVIAGVELNDKTIVLLDATNKNASPNIIPERAMNWFGRMIRKNGTSEMVNLYPEKSSIENVSVLAELKTDGTIKGKQRKLLTDYYAFEYRNENGNRNKENYIEELEKRENFSLVEEYKLDNLNDLTKPIIETYSFTSNSLVDIIGSKIYFSPMLFHQITENPFKAENRLYPVDFNFPIKDSYTFSIKIPEGYVLESKPESLNIAMEDNKGSFKYTVSENMGTIQFACSLEINAPIIESAYYQHLKEFFNQIVLKQNEKIVLIKK
ncbi:DUF3857 domain-containing protein [Flavobacterium celericrescens]|uniref:DUF3857 domain-containing protein n=1 Tax=Flavobacterium celericrescens TaxID=2709780 RepID=A0ABX0IDR7_9FLAO|nr:DUF3857 domain-containing protein [Flavobacterium celericrescens]NHM05370.1 DUF3857 domain-containing protein [Flavobacterium celericrescens]